MSRFAHQSEKLHQARSALMLPHTRGEVESIAEAFEHCAEALRGLTDGDLEPPALAWVRTIRAAMDTRSVEDHTNRGRFHAKAATLTAAEKLQLSDAVAQLASYFDRELWNSAQVDSSGSEDPSHAPGNARKGARMR